MAEGNDDGGHAVARKDAHRHTNLKEGEPEGLLVAPELVDPDGVVDKQEDLADTSSEPADIGGPLVVAEDEQKEGELQHDQGNHSEKFGVEVLVETAGEEPHDADA